MERFLAVAALQQGDDEACRERVAGGGAVNRLDARRCRACDLTAMFEQHGALLPEREREERLVTDELGLVAVRDDEVRLDRERACRRRVYAEPVSLPSRLAESRVLDLQLTEDVPGRREVPDFRVRARDDDDLVLPVVADEDDRDTGRRVDVAEREVDAGVS